MLNLTQDKSLGSAADSWYTGTNHCNKAPPPPASCMDRRTTLPPQRWSCGSPSTRPGKSHASTMDVTTSPWGVMSSIWS